MGSYLPPARVTSRHYPQPNLAITGFSDSGRMQGWVDLVGCYLPRWYTRSLTVTHPSTNRARRRITSFIRRTTLTTSPRRLQQNLIHPGHLRHSRSSFIDSKNDESNCRHCSTSAYQRANETARIATICLGLGLRILQPSDLQARHYWIQPSLPTNDPASLFRLRLNSTTRARPDPHRPARTFSRDPGRRPGSPTKSAGRGLCLVGSGRARVVEFSYYRTGATCVGSAMFRHRRVWNAWLTTACSA